MTSRRHACTTSPVDFSTLLIEKLRYTQPNILENKAKNIPFYTNYKETNGCVSNTKRVNKSKASKKIIDFTLNDNLKNHGISAQGNFSLLPGTFVTLVTPRKTGAVSRTRTTSYTKPKVCTISESTTSSIYYSDPHGKMESHWLSRVAFPPSHKAIAVKAKIECMKVCEKKKKSFETANFPSHFYCKNTFHTPRVLRNFEKTYSVSGQVGYNQCNVSLSHCENESTVHEPCKKKCYNNARIQQSKLKHRSLVQNEKKENVTTLFQQAQWHAKHPFLNQCGSKKKKATISDNNTHMTMKAIKKVDPSLVHVSKENITKSRHTHSYYKIQKPKIFHRLPCQLKTLSTLLILFQYAWIWDPQNAVSTTPVQMQMKIAFLYLRINSIYPIKNLAAQRMTRLYKESTQRVSQKGQRQNDRQKFSAQFIKIERNPSVTQLINKVFIRRFKRLFHVSPFKKCMREKKKTAFVTNPNCFSNFILQESVKEWTDVTTSRENMETSELKFCGSMQKEEVCRKNEKPQERKIVSQVPTTTVKNPQCQRVHEISSVLQNKPRSSFSLLSTNKVAYEDSENQKKVSNVQKTCDDACESKGINDLSKSLFITGDTISLTEMVSTNKKKHAEKTVQVVLLPTVSTTQDSFTNTDISRFVESNINDKLESSVVGDTNEKMASNKTCLSTSWEASEIFETPFKVLHAKNSCLAFPHVYVQVCPCLFWMRESNASPSSEINEGFKKTVSKEKGYVLDVLKQVQALQRNQMHSCCSDFVLFSENQNTQEKVKQQHLLNSSLCNNSTSTELTSSSLHNKFHPSPNTMINQVLFKKNALELLNTSSVKKTTGNNYDATVQANKTNISTGELTKKKTENSQSRSIESQEIVQDSPRGIVRGIESNSTILEEKLKCLNMYSSQCDVAFEDLHQQSERLENIIQELDRLQNQTSDESLHTTCQIQNLYQKLIGCQWILDTTSKSREEAALKRFKTLAYINQIKSYPKIVL